MYRIKYMNYKKFRVKGADPFLGEADPEKCFKTGF